METINDTTNVYSIIVISTKDNIEYKKFKQFVDKNIELFKNKKINVHEQLNENSNTFIIYLYKAMQLVDNINNFNETLIQNFVNSISDEKNKLQDGGNVDYREKYLKYRKKYKNLKKISTSLII